MNGLGPTARLGRHMRFLPAAVSIALFGLMAPFSVASASPLHLPPPTPEATSLTATLSTAATSGESITVTEGPRVRDTATLTGANAATARGRVTYTLYADSACTQELGRRGASGVVFGSVNPSQAARLPAGSYYWQASYSGDARDLPSLSACQAETVTPFIPWACSAISGRARDPMEGERHAAVFNLSTDLAAPRQRFALRWEGRERVRMVKLLSASCMVKMNHSVFVGTGTARFDGVSGFELRFTIVVGYDGTARVVAAVRSGGEPLVRELDAASADETTVFAAGVPVDLSALF